MLAICGFLFNLNDLFVPVPQLTCVPLHSFLSLFCPFKQRPDSSRLPFSGSFVPSLGRVQLWEVLAGDWRAEGREKLWYFFPPFDIKVFIQQGLLLLLVSSPHPGSLLSHLLPGDVGFLDSVHPLFQEVTASCYCQSPDCCTASCLVPQLFYEFPALNYSVLNFEVPVEVSAMMTMFSICISNTVATSKNCS